MNTMKEGKTMKKLVISMIMMFTVMNVLSYAFIYANWPCLLYDGQCPAENQIKGSSQNLSPTLGTLSIDAAGYFLQANSDFQAFLKRVELSEIYSVNNEELRALINASIENMKMANSLYYQVWQLSRSLARNPVVLQKLKQVDFQLLQDRTMLLPSIFDQVKGFLKPGNMPAAFEKIYSDTSDIIQGMESLKATLDSNSMDIPQCWDVNQRLLKSQLFGQYVSQVFSEVRESII